MFSRLLTAPFVAVQSITLALAMFGDCSAQDLLTVRIGVVAPTSGALSATGWANQRGAQLAIDEVNAQHLIIGGRRAIFEMLAEDDGGDPKQGTGAAQKLVDANVNGVIGHQTSGSSLPASRLYSAAGIPQISPSSTVPVFTRQGFRTTFRLAPDDAVLGSALAIYSVKELGLNKIAIIDDRTAYGHSISEEFSKAVRGAGGVIISHDYASDRTFDFSALLTTIKAKKPEAIFIGGMYSIAAPILRQMKHLNMKARVLGGDGICVEELVKLSSDAAFDDQVVCVEAGGVKKADLDRMGSFKSAFRLRFGAEPELISAYSYDAVSVMVDAMRKADSAEPRIYLAALANMQGHRGLTGNIAFNERGDLLHPSLAFYTFKGAARKQVDTIQLR